MKITIQQTAERDLEDAYRFYEDRLAGLGLEFLIEYESGLRLIVERPAAWQNMDATYRRYQLRRFPYGIIYRYDEPNQHIVIVAIAHPAMKPGSWKK